MIELKVKAREVIVNDTGNLFMSKNIPTKKAMKVTSTGIICFSGFGDNEQSMVIAKEVRDFWGNTESVTFCMDGRWVDRELQAYGSLSEAD